MSKILPNLLAGLNDWVGSQNLPPEFKISKERIEFVLQTATEEQNKYYFGYGDGASPFKKVACLCYAIAREHPICWEVSSGSELPAGSDILECNAKFALSFSCYMLSVATFNCAPTIIPPFNIKPPSDHFKKEFVKALAWGKLSTPAVALVLELLMYRCDKGKGLIGELDEKRVSQ